MGKGWEGGEWKAEGCCEKGVGCLGKGGNRVERR